MPTFSRLKLEDVEKSPRRAKQYEEAVKRSDPFSKGQEFPDGDEVQIVCVDYYLYTNDTPDDDTRSATASLCCRFPYENECTKAEVDKDKKRLDTLHAISLRNVAYKVERDLVSGKFVQNQTFLNVWVRNFIDSNRGKIDKDELMKQMNEHLAGKRFIVKRLPYTGVVKSSASLFGAYPLGNEGAEVDNEKWTIPQPLTKA